MQSELLQLSNRVRRNSKVTSISMATGIHLKVEEKNEQYHLLKMVRTKGQNGWEFAFPFPNLNLLLP